MKNYCKVMLENVDKGDKNVNKGDKMPLKMLPARTFCCDERKVV